MTNIIIYIHIIHLIEIVKRMEVRDLLTREMLKNVKKCQLLSIFVNSF
jgi:hypothetical protein